MKRKKSNDVINTKKKIKNDNMKKDKTTSKSKYSEKRKQKKENFLSTLSSVMPTRLVTTLKYYKNDFSVKTIFICYALMFISSVLLAQLAQLKLAYSIILIMVGLLLTPYVLLYGAKSSYEYQRFVDISNYTEQFLYTFKKKTKIQSTLDEIATVFPNGRLHNTVQKALDYIANTYDTNLDVEEEALRIIEKEYRNNLVHSIHSFALKAERNGGDCNTSLNLLFEERTIWIERIMNLQAEIKQVKRKNIVAIAVTAGICFLMSRIAPYSDNLMALTPMQLSMLCVLLFNFFTFLFFDKKGCVNWLEYEKNIDDEKSLKHYHEFVNYDNSKEMKFSFKLAILPIVIFIVGLLKKDLVVMGISTVFCIIMLLQHKIGYRILKKNLIQEVSIAYSRWLISLSLLLQTENVQNSISMSYDTAPLVLQPELAILIDGLKENPTAIEPYMNFMKDLKIEEVASGMRMLYSLSIGNGGKYENQIHEIIEHNHQLNKKANQVLDENSLACSNYMAYVLPGVYCCVFLIINLLEIATHFTTFINF